MSQVEALQRQIEDLREEVQAWKAYAEDKVREALGRTVEFPASWRLTALEARTLALLMHAGDRPSSKAKLHAGLYASRLGGSEPDEKIVDIYVMRLRRKLKPVGITIETIWGVGFFLPAESRALLASIAGGSQ